VGGPVLEFLIKERIPVIVVEFNPHLVEELADEKVNVIYGDASDPEILEHLNLNQAKLIISTATDPQDTLMLLSECKVRRLTAYIVVRSLDQEHVAEFKRSGADFVITPETVSGEYIVDKIRNHWLKSETR
jgi:CPA2 family monovalent cation:H+ antiporter-2